MLQWLLNDSAFLVLMPHRFIGIQLYYRKFIWLYWLFLSKTGFELKTITKMATTNILFLQMGGTIDKDYPRTKLGYSFEIGPPAILPILNKIKPALNFSYEIKTICQKDSQELEDQDRYLKAQLNCS